MTRHERASAPFVLYIDSKRALIAHSFIPIDWVWVCPVFLLNEAEHEVGGVGCVKTEASRKVTESATLGDGRRDGHHLALPYIYTLLRLNSERSWVPGSLLRR